MSPVKVNSLVELLYTHNREEYDELLEMHPDHRETLKLGNYLGEVSAETRVLAELSMKSLSVAMTSINNTIFHLQKKLSRANKVRLFGNIIGASTSAGIISLVFIGSKRLALLTAFINFSASICLIVSNFIQTSIYGTKQNINEFIQSLINSAVDADKLSTDISLLLKTNDSDEKIIDAVRKANHIAAEIRAIEMYTGER